MKADVVVLLHNGHLLDGEDKAMLVAADISFQELDLASAQAVEVLKQTQPTVVVMDGSNEEFSHNFTVNQVFRLCPNATVVCIHPASKTLEVHYSLWSISRCTKDLASVIGKLLRKRCEMLG